MIINTERKPDLSLYFIGGIILTILKRDGSLSMESLYKETLTALTSDIHIDFFYYALDWLFLLSAIKLSEERVCLCV